MKTVEKWRWKIRWAGRWTATRIPYTETEVRREHPEATRIDSSRVEVQLPETDAEIDAFQRPARRSASQGEP